MREDFPQAFSPVPGSALAQAPLLAPVSTPKQKRFGRHSPPKAIIEIGGSEDGSFMDSLLGSTDSPGAYIPGNNNTPLPTAALELPFIGASPMATSSPLAMRISSGNTPAPYSPSPAAVPLPAARVFVTGFRMWAHRQQVYTAMKEHFSQYGNVDFLQLRHSPQGMPFAFVQFKDTESAERACISGHGANLCGWALRVEEARVPRTLFLQSQFRGQNMAKEQVFEIVHKYGPLEQVLAYNKYGSGWFVQFVFQEDAVIAYHSIISIGMCGRHNVDCKWVENVKSSKKCNYENQNTVHMANLPVTTSSLQVRNLVGDSVAILSIELRMVRERESKYAYVKLQTPEMAHQVVQALDGAEYFGRHIIASIRTYVPRLCVNTARPPKLPKSEFGGSHFGLFAHGAYNV